MVVFLDNKEPIQEASNYTEMDTFLDVLCCNADCYNESVISDIKKSIINVSDLWKQWTKNAKSFVKHKWIYRYVTQEQKERLEKHYEVLKAEKTNYSSYKRSFATICKFLGLPTDQIILENVVFKKDNVDKDQDIIAVRYSKGKIKVNIPEGINLIHAHVASDGVKIDNLIPSFRSKTVGKYMYPSKRCFFTCIKAIDGNKANIQGKTNKYTPKTPITAVYIDPTYSDFSSNSVYVETDTPIPVVTYRSFLYKLFKKNENNQEED